MDRNETHNHSTTRHCQYSFLTDFWWLARIWLYKLSTSNSWGSSSSISIAVAACLRHTFRWSFQDAVSRRHIWFWWHPVFNIHHGLARLFFGKPNVYPCYLHRSWRKNEKNNLFDTLTMPTSFWTGYMQACCCRTVYKLCRPVHPKVQGSL